ncbi:MAG: F0F1 ATP synthase subunit A [Candidatus Sulfotelmatobacter sp.]
MEQLLANLVNKYFGGAALVLLHALHISSGNPRAPIPGFVVIQMLLAVAVIGLFLIVRMNLSVEHPGQLQIGMESLREFISNTASQTIGAGSEQFVPYLMALGMFILACNLIGLIPGFESPTAVPAVPLGCALLTWFYYHSYGVRENGFIKYLKHFIGPQEDLPLVLRLFLPFLLFPIEIFSQLARVMSLTVRLYANMFAGEMVTLVFFSLVPLALPVVFMGLHLGVALIQTYIFVLLATIYLAEAVAHEH